MESGIGAQLGLSDTPLTEVVVNVIQLALGLLTLVALFVLMIGAFRWIVTGSNEEFRDQAKRMMLNAIFGQILVIIAWAIVQFVAQTVLQVSG